MLTIKKTNYVDLQAKAGINSWDAFVLCSNPFNFVVCQLLASLEHYIPRLFCT